MYKYDQYDQAIVDARVEEFRDQVARRLSGAITEDQFKPLRLMNGLYLQLHAYMLRIAIPYGTLNSRQLRMLAHIARTYDKGYGHFTTRQNLQFNWPALSDVPAILADLASVEILVPLEGHVWPDLHTPGRHIGAALRADPDRRLILEEGRRDGRRQREDLHPGHIEEDTVTERHALRLLPVT